MNEKLLERKLRDGVKAQRGYAIKFFAPTFTGLPDRIVLKPRGRVWFVEVKTTGKQPTARQLFVHDLLKGLGFEVWVIDTQELLNQFLNEISKH